LLGCCRQDRNMWTHSTIKQVTLEIFSLSNLTKMPSIIQKMTNHYQLRLRARQNLQPYGILLQL
jgi:hypothetical protein